MVDSGESQELGEWMHLTLLRSSTVRRRLAMCTAVAWICASASASAASTNRVLILAGTVTGGEASIEASEAIAKGMTVDIVDGETFASLTAAQFGGYRAIILGDPTCQGLGSDQNSAAASAQTWGPAINGNIVIVGSDPVFHASQGGAAVTRAGVDFALAQAGKTGAYITLSCYYHDTASGTAVPLLDGIGGGGFKVGGVGCYNNAHIVAASPALTGISDADLSNWSCSVHEAFTAWPASLVPLAIARDFDSSFTASDGTQGPPYILAGGNIKSFPLSLSPLSASKEAGGSHSVTAELLDGTTRAPLAGARIGFRVSSGPNAGSGGMCAPSSCQTDASGNVRFTYRSCGAIGTDRIQAFYDTNLNGAADVGEPQTTASAAWTQINATNPGRWPHTCGVPLQIYYTYGGDHKYLGNVVQGAANWSAAGTRLRIGQWPGAPLQEHVRLSDDSSIKHDWFALTTTRWSSTFEMRAPATMVFNSSRIAGFFGISMEGLDNFMRTKVATHEFGHSVGLAHPADFGIDSRTDSVMHQGNRAYNTPMPFDKTSVGRKYP